MILFLCFTFILALGAFILALMASGDALSVRRKIDAVDAFRGKRLTNAQLDRLASEDQLERRIKAIESSLAERLKRSPGPAPLKPVPTIEQIGEALKACHAPVKRNRRGIRRDKD